MEKPGGQTKCTFTASRGMKRVSSSQAMLIKCLWWIDHQQM